MTAQSCSDVQSLYICIALKPVFLMLSITPFPLGNTNLVSFVNPLKHFDGLTNLTSSSSWALLLFRYMCGQTVELKCRASQDHGATWIQTYNNEVKQYKTIHNWPTVRFDYTCAIYKSGYLYINIKNTNCANASQMCKKRNIQAAGWETL